MKLKDLVGKKITAVRYMTRQEMEAEGWDGPPTLVFVLSNGLKMYASQDPEGNGPGEMFFSKR